MRFVFHHIQKTGGVSVERAAKRVMTVERAVDWTDLSPIDWMVRHPADWHSSHYLFRDFVPDDEVYLTWIRHPVSMFYSAFYFWHRAHPKQHEFTSVETTRFINDVLKHCRTIEQYVDDVLANDYAHAFPKTMFDLNWDRFDFIGECEDMAGSIRRFNAEFGTNLEPKHQNPSKGRDRHYRRDEVETLLAHEVDIWKQLTERNRHWTP